MANPSSGHQIKRQITREPTAGEGVVPGAWLQQPPRRHGISNPVTQCGRFANAPRFVPA